ncbi:MAG TPA: hypothetical protein VN736_01235 [Candidatus Limnocylindrales bacterium]|nr:hypothetical protein [Candidatus Limnocylindrales bacterium]
MKAINVRFAERFGLANFVGQTSGTLAKLSAMQRIYDAVRFNESEMAQVKVTDLGNGLSNVAPPSDSFGEKTIELEDGDAQMLLQEIEGYQRFTMSDMKWVNSVKDQLILRK